MKTLYSIISELKDVDKSKIDMAWKMLDQIVVETNSVLQDAIDKLMDVASSTQYPAISELANKGIEVLRGLPELIQLNIVGPLEGVVNSINKLSEGEFAQLVISEIATDLEYTVNFIKYAVNNISGLSTLDTEAFQRNIISVAKKIAELSLLNNEADVQAEVNQMLQDLNTLVEETGLILRMVVNTAKVV